jgi:DNA-binding LacI/PurR family transcriptional regulator
VKSRATQSGVNVIISMPEELDARGCTAALQDLLAQRVDGLLVNVPLDDEQAEALSALAGPVPVLFLDVSETAAVNSLIFDADQGQGLVPRICWDRGICALRYWEGRKHRSLQGQECQDGWRRWKSRDYRPVAVNTATGVRRPAMKKGICFWRQIRHRRLSSLRTIKWPLA